MESALKSIMNVSKLAGRWGAVCGVVVAGLWLAGCQSGPDPRFSDVPGRTGPDNGAMAANGVGSGPTGDPTDASLDILQANDAIEIDYADITPLPQPFRDRIKADGTITLVLNET